MLRPGRGPLDYEHAAGGFHANSNVNAPVKPHLQTGWPFETDFQCLLTGCVVLGLEHRNLEALWLLGVRASGDGGWHGGRTRGGGRDIFLCRASCSWRTRALVALYLKAPRVRAVLPSSSLALLARRCQSFACSKKMQQLWRRYTKTREKRALPAQALAGLLQSIECITLRRPTLYNTDRTSARMVAM